MPPPILSSKRNVNGQEVDVPPTELAAAQAESDANYAWPFTMTTVRPDQLKAEIAAQLPTPQINTPSGTLDDYGVIYSALTGQVSMKFGVALTQQQQTTLAAIIAAHTPAITSLEKADHSPLQGRLAVANLFLNSTLITRNGTTTNGSAVVTGLAQTSDLAVGMFVAAAAGIQGGTTILSIDSATQITLSANASASGARLIQFTKASQVQRAWAQAVIDAAVSAFGAKIGV